jgi:hypothetical protein
MTSVKNHQYRMPFGQLFDWPQLARRARIGHLHPKAGAPRMLNQALFRSE